MPRRLWTRAEADAAIAVYRQQVNRRLTAYDFRNNPALPTAHQVYKLYGSLIPLTGGRPGTSVVRQASSSGLQGQRRCLCCDHIYRPEHRWHRICHQCKQTDAWRDDGEAWMNGPVVG